MAMALHPPGSFGISDIVIQLLASRAGTRDTAILSTRNMAGTGTGNRMKHHVLDTWWVLDGSPSHNYLYTCV